MISFAVFLASVAAYLVIGWRFVAPRFVARDIARETAKAAQWQRTASYAAECRRDAAEAGVAVGIMWPLYVVTRVACLLGRLLVSGIAARAPLTDLEVRHALAARDRRIAELERQMELREQVP